MKALPPDDLYDLKEFYAAIQSKFSEEEIQEQCESIAIFAFALKDMIVLIDRFVENPDEYNETILRTICFNLFKMCLVNKRFIKTMMALHPKFTHLIEDIPIAKYRD